MSFAYFLIYLIKETLFGKSITLCKMIWIFLMFNLKFDTDSNLQQRSGC